MYKSIKTPLPFGISEESKKLFLPISAYKVKQPTIRKIKNAFVTHEGLVLKNGFLVKGCAFNLIGKEDYTFYRSFWKLALEQFAVAKWGSSLPSLHLKGPTLYLLIHSKWFNYAFWVTDSLRRLVQAENEGWLQSAKLIVPESWKTIPYVWDSLKAFKLDMVIVPAGYHLFVDNLIMPETREWTASFGPDNMGGLRNRLLDTTFAKENNHKFKGVDKVYLSRSKRGVRSVLNEDEVIELIAKYGYKPVIFEDLSFWEQVNLMKQAKSFVAIHGAGFANILFMPKGSKTIEMMDTSFAYYFNPFPHWKLANATGIAYSPLFCNKNDLMFLKRKRNSAIRMDLVNKDIVVDTKALEKLL